MRLRLVVATGFLILAALTSAPAAYASCGTEAKVSPDAFVGTVINTQKHDRVATVITDGGRRVTVLGSEATRSFPETFGSTDRRYALGGRYEFHPINTESPYLDNTCTATHQLAGPRLRPLEPTNDFLPSWLPVDEQAGLLGYLVLFGPVAAAMALLIFVGCKAFRQLTTHRPQNGD